MTEQINWGSLIEQAGKELEPVPKGTYDVVVEDAQDAQTSTQKLMYKLKFRIQGGPSNNRVLWNNITLTTDNPSALAMFFRNMDALGLDRQFFSMNPTPSQVAEALIGRTTRVVIDHRLYQGSMRENVKQMLKPTGVMGMVGMPGVGAPVGIPVPGAPSFGTPPVQPSAPISSPIQDVPAVAPPAAAPTPVAPAAPVPVAVQPSPEPTPPPVPVTKAPAPAPIPEPAPPAPEPEPEVPAAPAIDLDAYRAAGWTDAQLIAAGHMEAPAAPAPAPPAPPAAPEAPAAPAVSGPPAPPPVPF